MKSFAEIIGAYFNVERFNQKQKDAEMYTISKVETYIVGFFISALVAGVTLFLLGLISALLPFGLINAFTIIASLGAGVVFFGLGIVTIDVGYVGVVLVLGERLRNVQLGEGTFWLLPFFTSAEYVDRKQQYSDVKENEIITSDFVLMLMDVDVTWRIRDPYLRLNSNLKDVEGAVKAAAQSAMVSIGAKKKRTELVAMHNERVEANPEMDYAEMSELESEITKEVDRKIEIFGGHAVRVYIPTLKPDNKLVEQEQRFAIEQAQQKAEQVQNKHVIAEVNRIVADTGMTPETAMQMFLTQIEKAEYKIDQKNWNMNQESRDALVSVANGLIAMFGKRAS